ncbi:MAG: hypothetical protein IT371_20690 [Deltaproteobacteria bacterium]|nr:hypothetical protein [Deltaproteobacteria bacterium]
MRHHPAGATMQQNDDHVQTRWFIPARVEVPPRRASLTLGLGAAVRFYRELQVPGIGGVRFVRQISWAVAGLAIAEECHVSPARVANAIEALACKHAWASEVEGVGRERVLGVRAFPQEPDAWSFAELCQARYYVQNTYRQATVAALADEGGLGFTTGSRLFNGMKLSAHGRELAKLFLSQVAGRGEARLSKQLLDWVGGARNLGRTAYTAGRALSPRWAKFANAGGPDEGALVLARLQATTRGDLPGTDPERRSHLLDAFEVLQGTDGLPPLHAALVERLRVSGYAAQVAELEVARAFGEVLGAARRLVHAVAQALAEDQREVAPASELAPDERVRAGEERLLAAFEDYRRCARGHGRSHPEALHICDALGETGDSARRIEQLVARDGAILRSPGAGRIERGELFASHKELAVDAEDDEAAEIRGAITPRLRQLHGLWRDCHAS